jgi:hypothetical protein
VVVSMAARRAGSGPVPVGRGVGRVGVREQDRPALHQERCPAELLVVHLTIPSDHDGLRPVGSGAGQRDPRVSQGGEDALLSHDERLGDAARGQFVRRDQRRGLNLDARGAIPNPLSRPATASGVRPELFVTNATCLSAARSRAIASGAPGTTSDPR